MKKIIPAVIIAAIFSAVPTEAQVSGFSDHGFGIGFGWYRPLMDYWNETSYVSGWDQGFEGALDLHAHARLRITSRFALRLGVGFWKETVDQDGVWLGTGLGREEVSLQFIPFTGTFLLALPVFRQFAVPYIGVGGGAYAIRKTVTRTVEGADPVEDVDDGLDFAAHIVIGTEMPVFWKLGAGLEFRYVLGDYVQEVEDLAGAITNEVVLISGPQVILSAFVRF